MSCWVAGVANSTVSMTVLWLDGRMLVVILIVLMSCWVAVVAGVSNLVLSMSLLWLEPPHGLDDTDRPDGLAGLLMFLTSRISMAGIPNSMVSMIVLGVEGPVVLMILIVRMILLGSLCS